MRGAYPWGTVDELGLRMRQHVEAMVNAFCRLVVDLERAMHGESPNAPAERWSLTTPELGIVLALDQFGALRPGTIAELGGFSSGATSKMIARLERDGLVVRLVGAHASDRRAVEVRVTDRGREALQDFEQVVIDLADEVVRSFDLVLSSTEVHAPLSGGQPEDVPGPAGVVGSVLAQLYRFLSVADGCVLEVVGDIGVLHPSDPRGILVLGELDRVGSMRLGEVGPLVGRSRASATSLVDHLDAQGLLRRVGDEEDGRAVRIDLTPVGRAVIRGVHAAVAAALPALQPVMAELRLELAHAAS